MKKFNIEIPESIEEFDALSDDKKEEILNMARKEREALNQFLTYMAQEVIAPIMLTNSEINDVCLDPKYEYNDEGYAPNYVMPLINGDVYAPDDCEDIQDSLDNACSGFSDLMTEDIYIDSATAKQIVAKQNANKLEEELPKKKKGGRNRYKM